MRKTIHESEMALFFECMRSCAHRVLDIADIVREGIFRQLSALEEPGRAVSGVKGVRACQECLIRVQSYTASEKTHDRSTQVAD